MKIGLIDVDGHNFPNLPLMKLSAHHKRKDDAVEWYNPLLAWKYPYDRVYMSKVFRLSAPSKCTGGYPRGNRIFLSGWRTDITARD